MLCGMDALSEIEKIKLIKSLNAGFSSGAAFLDFVKSHNLYFGDWNEFKRRMHGLFAEDDFELLCALSEKFTFMSSLSQSKKIPTNIGSSPDFLAIYINENRPYKAFFEVKSETKEALKKPAHKLKNINVDKIMNTDLFVASRIERGTRGTWLIHTKDEFIRLGRCGFVEAFESCINNFILGDKAIEIHDRFTLKCNYKLRVGEILRHNKSYPITEDFFASTASLFQLSTPTQDGDWTIFDFPPQVILLSEICFEMNMRLNNQYHKGLNSDRFLLAGADDAPQKEQYRKYGFSSTLAFIQILSAIGAPIRMLDW